MKIIDNHKDYYDYLQGVYGQDPLAVFDRRGSTWFNKETMPLPLRPVPETEKKGLIGRISIYCGLVCHAFYFENLPGQKISYEEFGTFRLASRETKIPIRIHIEYIEHTVGTTKTHMKWVNPNETQGFPIRYPNGCVCHEDEFFSDGVDRWRFEWRTNISNPILASIPLMIIPPQQVFDHVHEFLLSLNDTKTED